jgi:hypothetical protein
MGLRLGAGAGVDDATTGEPATWLVLVGDALTRRSVADGSPAGDVVVGEPATGEQSSTSEALIARASHASRIMEASHSRQRNTLATARSREGTKTTPFDGQRQKVHARVTNDVNRRATELGIAEELEKLTQLHERGVLSDQEYAEAKQTTLRGATKNTTTDEQNAAPVSGDRTLGEAANRYVSFQILMAGISFVIVLVLLVTVVLPRFSQFPR